MNTISFGNYDWITQERWGAVHTDKPYVWYDADMVQPHSANHLSLFTRHKPKYFSWCDATPEMAVGLISCKHEFDYGVFSLDAKLPNIAYAWPAFWMYSWKSWPPEIDVFEGYANRRGNYRNNIIDRILGKPYNVETNVHLLETKNIGGEDGYIKEPMRWNNYKVDWHPNYIKIYYNDRLVRSVEDAETLKYFEGHKMNVIINNSFYKSHHSHKILMGELEVKNFVYEAH